MRLPLEVEVSVTREDYFEACRVYWAADRDQYRKHKRWMKAGVALMGIGFFIVFMGARTDGLVAIALGALILFWQTRIRGEDVEKAWLKYARLAEPTTLRFTEDSVRIVTSLSDCTFRWGAFDRIIVSRTLILSFDHSGRMRILPKRGFPDDDHWRFITAFLDDRINHRLNAFPVALLPVAQVPISNPESAKGSHGSG